MFNDINIRVLSDDLSTWRIIDLKIELNAGKRDALRGFADPAHQARLEAEIEKRKQA